jgi:hypothetical protein
MSSNSRNGVTFMGKFYSTGHPIKARVEKASASASAKATSKSSKIKASDPVTEPVDTALAALQGSIASANLKKLENTQVCFNPPSHTQLTKSTAPSS